MSDSHKHIEDLIEKACAAVKPDDAMRYSQAALNAANAVLGLAAARKQAADGAPQA